MKKELADGFTQVVVWPATIVKDEEIEDMIQWFADEFKVRIQFLETIITKPGDGGPGGRSDVLFALHNEDIGKFVIPKLRLGCRWIEDVIDNARSDGGLCIYPNHFVEYYSWRQENELAQ